MKLRFTHFLFLLTGLFLGCSEQVDFDQANEVSLTSTQDIDLVYFTLSQDTFVDGTGQLQQTGVVEAVKLDFLDDPFFQNHLIKIVFAFKMTNTFPQDLTAVIKFNDSTGVTRESIALEAAGSPDGTEVISEYEVVKEGAAIDNITNADNVLVEYYLNTDGSPIVGSLTFESKAAYTVEL